MTSPEDTTQSPHIIEQAHDLAAALAEAPQDVVDQVQVELAASGLELVQRGHRSDAKTRADRAASRVEEIMKLDDETPEQQNARRRRMAIVLGKRQGR